MAYKLIINSNDSKIELNIREARNLSICLSKNITPINKELFYNIIDTIEEGISNWKDEKQ